MSKAKTHRELKKIELSSTYGKVPRQTIDNLPFTITQVLEITNSNEVLARVATRAIAITLSLALSEEYPTIRFYVTGMGLNTTIINGEIK